jgi:hypothetical protein
MMFANLQIFAPEMTHDLFEFQNDVFGNWRRRKWSYKRDMGGHPKHATRVVRSSVIAHKRLDIGDGNHEGGFHVATGTVGTR